MEQKSKKIDVKIIIIAIIVIVAIVEGIVILANNKGIKLDISNYTDYMSNGNFSSMSIPGTEDKERKIIFSITGLSENYDYSNIEIEVLLTSEYYKINEIKKAKCKVNGYTNIETGLTYKTYFDDINNAKNDLKFEIKSINGTLKPIK